MGKSSSTHFSFQIKNQFCIGNEILIDVQMLGCLESFFRFIRQGRNKGDTRQFLVYIILFDYVRSILFYYYKMGRMMIITYNSMWQPNRSAILIYALLIHRRWRMISNVEEEKCRYWFEIKLPNLKLANFFVAFARVKTEMLDIQHPNHFLLHIVKRGTVTGTVHGTQIAGRKFETLREVGNIAM